MTRNIVIVAPYLGSTMITAIKGFLTLSNVRLGLITQQPQQLLPAKIAQHITDHYQIANCLDSTQLSIASQAFIKEWGRIDRLVGYLEHLQLPLAQVRTTLGIYGMKEKQALGFRDKNTMKSILGNAQLGVAKQARIHSAAEVQHFIAKCGYPIVLKPLAGVGSKNTMRILRTPSY